MCYCVTGYVNKSANWEEVEAVLTNHLGGFDKHPDVDLGPYGMEESRAFRFNTQMCDCGTDFGSGRATTVLKNYAFMFQEILHCEGVAYMAVLKSDYSGLFSEFQHGDWYDVTTHPIGGLTAQDLAEMEEDTFLQIVYRLDDAEFMPQQGL